jgi:hypothetical protein
MLYYQLEILSLVLVCIIYCIVQRTRIGVWTYGLIVVVPLSGFKRIFFRTHYNSLGFASIVVIEMIKYFLGNYSKCRQVIERVELFAVFFLKLTKSCVIQKVYVPNFKIKGHWYAEQLDDLSFIDK